MTQYRVGGYTKVEIKTNVREVEKVMSLRKLALATPLNVGGTTFNPEQLTVIGSIVEQGTSIEVTPFKQLYVLIDELNLTEAENKLASAGIIVLPAGFVTKNLQACNFCKGEEEAGLPFARRLDEVVSGLDVPTPLKIGYAGCALGTSEPLSKDISVVKMRDVYDIYIGGDVKGIKPVFAQLLLASISEERVIPVVQRLIAYYQTNAKGKEKFPKFITRIGFDKLREIVSA